MVHDWENRYENEIWTYGLEDIWSGLQDCYQDLKKAYSARYQRPLTDLAGMGFSGMMHGYMVIPFVTTYAFALLVIGFALLVLGLIVKGL